jgi:hypothetical protein
VFGSGGPAGSRPFEELLEDEQVGYITDIGEPGPVLVCFGGLLNHMGMPHFEFFSLLRDVPCNKIFIRDLDQVFYQRGVRGLGETVPAAADGIRALVSGHHPVVFVGNSAGGFGALLFGALTKPDDVLAFAPETFVSRLHRRINGDHRWAEEVDTMYRLANLERKYLDLKRVLRRHPGPTTYQIHYAKWNKLDARHALRMGSLARVSLHPKASKRHGVIRDLRDDGSLKPLITGLLEPR